MIPSTEISDSRIRAKNLPPTCHVESALNAACVYVQVTGIRIDIFTGMINVWNHRRPVSPCRTSHWTRQCARTSLFLPLPDGLARIDHLMQLTYQTTTADRMAAGGKESRHASGFIHLRGCDFHRYLARCKHLPYPLLSIDRFG